MIQAKRSFVKCGDWFTRISHFELCNRVSSSPSVSLNNDKICREFSEHKIAVCGKTAGLRSGNSSDLNSACLKVLVPVEIFQLSDMHYQTEQYRDSTDGLFLLISRMSARNPLDKTKGCFPVTRFSHVRTRA